MSLPTCAGSMCWYSIGSTLIALACSPALCANADRPTYGWCWFGETLVTSATACAIRVSSASAAVGTTVAPLLQLQVGDDAEQVGVAGALAVAVRGALHVGHAGVHGGEGVGHGAGGVVVAVDAEPGVGRRQHLGHDVRELGREHAAVGVAQRDDVGAGGGRGPYHLERVRRVGAVAVEEVLGVQEDPLALVAQVPHGVLDHRQVLLQRRAQRQLDVPVVRLRDQRHDGGAAVAQRGDQRVVGSLAAGPSGRAERGQRRVLEVELGPGPREELGVLRVGARPAALDEADAELVQVPRDGQLVGDREGQALLLRAVAQAWCRRRGRRRR